MTPTPDPLHVNWNWYKGQKYQVLEPQRRIGRWTWVAHLNAGKTLTGKAFRKTAAIENAKRAIKKALINAVEISSRGGEDAAL